MSYIKLQNIFKVYDNGFEAVKDFNLEINDGEFIVLVGPSGCGKSTTLRMIAGLEEISKGKMYIDDKLVNNVSPRDRGIAMVFQSYALYPHLSVFDNLAFGLTLEGIDEDEIEKRVVKTAETLGLGKLLDRRPRELSGGQRQRVALGRAIIRRAKVFLMDEPLSNLDAKQRVTTRGEIIAIHRKIGATTVYVTHDQTEAMTMADRMVVMREGIVQQTGTPHELYFHPSNMFVAGFIGEPPMNFMNGVVNSGRVLLGETAIDLGAAFKRVGEYEGREVVVGFRPESAEFLDGENKKGITLSAQAEVTELLGDYVNIYAKIHDNKVILRANPHLEPKINDTVTFGVAYENLFVFDAKTQQTII